MTTKLMTTIIIMLLLASITTIGIIPVKAQLNKVLIFRVTSADIIAGVDALNQWLVANGMDTFGGANMPREARIPGQTIMSLVHSIPQRWLGDFWLYPYDPYYYFGGEGGNPKLGFDTWTSVIGQTTNVGDWVSDNAYWGWGIPWWHAEHYDTYPNPAFLNELIAPPGSSTNEFYFTILIDTSQADANGKYRFFFSGESYRKPPIGGSDVSQFLGFVDLAPLPPHAIKLDAIAELKASKTGDDMIDKKIDEIIKDIKKSLEDGLWLDDMHLDPKHGHKVFEREKEAVMKIQELLKHKDLPDDVGATLEIVIGKLFAADEMLAETALNDAKAIPDPDKKIIHEIMESEKELAKAEKAFAKGDPDNAIDHYKHAWEHAQQALGHVP